MATLRQIKANRRNAKKGGPKTPEGKAVVRTNALEHGVFASTLTDQDHEELVGLYDRLAAWLRPVGPVEEMLVEKLAQTYVRLQRCARAEAEFHIETWQRKAAIYAVEEYARHCRDGLHASWFDAALFQRAAALFARYDTTLTNQLIKLLHEIERVQRLRAGEAVPPPLVADLTFTADQADAAAAPESPGPVADAADLHVGEALPSAPGLPDVPQPSATEAVRG